MGKCILPILLSTLIVANMAAPMNQHHEEAHIVGEHIIQGTVHHQNATPTHSDKVTVRGEKASSSTGQASKVNEAERLDKHHFIEDIQTGRPFEYRITNIETGQEEQYDADKHFFDPIRHHPVLKDTVLNRFQLNARGSKMPLPEFHARHRSITHTYDATGHISKPGGVVIDPQNKHLYSHHEMSPEEALKTMHDGNAKKLKRGEDGSIFLSYTNNERREREEICRDHWRLQVLMGYRSIQKGIDKDAAKIKSIRPTNRERAANRPRIQPCTTKRQAAKLLVLNDRAAYHKVRAAAIQAQKDKKPNETIQTELME